MKKITMILLMGILLVGTLGAVTLSVYSTKDRTSKTLSDAGIDSYEVSPIVCDTEKCDTVRLNIPGIVDKRYNPKPYYMNCTNFDVVEYECMEEEKVYYTNAELESQRDTWEANVIGIAENYLKEVEQEKTEKVEGVEVTIKDK